MGFITKDGRRIFIPDAGQAAQRVGGGGTVQRPGTSSTSENDQEHQNVVGDVKNSIGQPAKVTSTYHGGHVTQAAPKGSGESYGSAHVTSINFNKNIPSADIHNALLKNGWTASASHGANGMDFMKLASGGGYHYALHSKGPSQKVLISSPNPKTSFGSSETKGPHFQK